MITRRQILHSTCALAVSAALPAAENGKRMVTLRETWSDTPQTPGFTRVPERTLPFRPYRFVQEIRETGGTLVVEEVA